MKKREGALGEKSEAAHFFEGDASHIAQARPLTLRIEETKPPYAIALQRTEKAHLKTPKMSLISIRQECCRFFLIYFSALGGLCS